MDRRDVKMAIKVENLCKSYQGKEVLQNLNMEFSEGKITCIMAPSGKGKTTLLRILIGLEQPDSGRISGMEEKDISVVFQEDRLCENLNALSNIRLVQKGKRLRKQEFFEKIQEGLEAMDILECRYQPVRELSGGMRRRVAILRALYTKWDILFLDEPFKGLDKETKKKVILFLKKSCQGKTVICVTHDEKEAENLGAEIQCL